eukprot:203239-Chlamydomonas_euryale.AAC.3
MVVQNDCPVACTKSMAASPAASGVVYSTSDVSRVVRVAAYSLLTSHRMPCDKQRGLRAFGIERQGLGTLGLSGLRDEGWGLWGFQD